MVETEHVVGEMLIRAKWSPDHIGPIEMVITPTPQARKGRGITHSMLKGIAIRAIQPRQGSEEGDVEELADWLAIRTREHSVGGNGHPELFYAKAALLYRLLMDEGTPDPTRAIADLTAVRIRTVQGWIKRARAIRVLTRSEAYNGRIPYGNLTDKARGLLLGDS